MTTNKVYTKKIRVFDDMNATLVLHSRTTKLHKRVGRGKVPPKLVYIGRPSKWGNPFKVSKDRTAQEAVELYKEYIGNADLPISELWNRDLACWCGEWILGTEPEIDCHGVVLMQLASKSFNEWISQIDGLEDME